MKLMNLLSPFRDRWPDSMTERPPVPSLRHTDDDDEGDDSDEVEGLERDEDHVYQSLERQSRADDINVVYAVPIKHRKVQSCVCMWIALSCYAFDSFTKIHHEVELPIYLNPALNQNPV